MRITRRMMAALSAALIGHLAFPALSLAGNQARAGINLGATSFFDGFGRPTEGFTYQVYLQYSRSRELHDPEGREITTFRNPELDTVVWLNQLTYMLPHTIFGESARPGINFILPAVGFLTNFDAPGPQLRDNGFGLGDLTFGPVLQFKPLAIDGRPVFSQRFELDLIVPTGKYDPERNFNQGTNYTSFNPNWAVSVLPFSGAELSARLNYIYNFTNERPVNPPRGLMVESARAAQSVWINFAASYEPLEHLHIGANGYYLKQLTADRFFLADGSYTDGRGQGEGKQQVLGIGPGVLADVTKQDKLFANVYFQFLVEARPVSQAFSLRWLHSF